jgi:signal transduction histidine kinase/CheY-like chemotaxis protein
MYQNQITYQKNILFSQADLCGSNIESVVQRFESDLNYILFSDDVSELFREHAESSNSLRKLELFYSSYTDLIKNIDIYDNNKNVFNLFKDKKFISDKYIAQRQRKLVAKEQIRIRDNEYHYHIPVFNENLVYGNIVVSINLTEYLLKELSKFYVNGVCYQWVIDPVSGGYATNFPGNDLIIKDYSQIIDNLKNDLEGLSIHTIENDSTTTDAITAYKPISVLDHKFGIAFTFNNEFFIGEIFSKVAIVGGLSLLLFLLTIFLLFSQVSRSEKKKVILSNDYDLLRNVFNNLPIGAMVIDPENKIVQINQIACEMFLLRKGEEANGNAITEKYLMSGRSLKLKNKPSAYDTSQFILYEREGNEIILYRKEIPYLLNGKEFTLSAFIDITSIEKSRKYEAASNTAKSEFLAKMSHEIRTPMNGILGMTEALKQENLTSEQREYVDIVKRSADLLLNIIDDILDYSKIEAGKMQLEEIPFKIRDEVKFSLDLFRAIIDEKGLELKTDIADNIPEEIIGDPFRLRQVLSNLISNAVKFTHDGEISIRVKLDEKYSGNLTVLFEISDTGVGIPKERLDSIFNSFTQADYSTSRKYGGSGLGTTIARQLVNLMNGEIWVESPSGLSRSKNQPGSKFCFTIEVYSNEELEKELDFSDLQSFSEIGVFLIGHSLATKKRLISFLNHLGIVSSSIELHEKKDPIESIKEQLSMKSHQVLIILDDIDIDGMWIARQLSHLGLMEKYRSLLISSKHKQENYIQSKVARVDYYLTQPFEQNILKNYLFRWFPAIREREEKKINTLQKDLNILVAEDNLINQKVAETIFSHLGYKIDLALDGRKAVEMVKKKAYDIIFMDIEMPEKDGIDATVEVRGLGFQMPIVAMTATSSKIGKDNAITSGMNDYITKPVKSEIVLSVLCRWFS